MLSIKSVLFFALALHQVCGMESQSYAHSSRAGYEEIVRERELQVIGGFGGGSGGITDFVSEIAQSRIDDCKIMPRIDLCMDKRSFDFDPHIRIANSGGSSVDKFNFDLDRLMGEYRIGGSLYCEQKPLSCCQIAVKWMRYGKQGVASLFHRVWG